MALLPAPPKQLVLIELASIVALHNAGAVPFVPVNESLKKQAVDLANLMFFEVIKKTMLTLGIDDISRSQTWFKFSDLKSHLGENFYNHEKLDIEIGLVFTNKMKEGFIRLMILK